MAYELFEFTKRDRLFLICLPALIYPIESIVGSRDFFADTYTILDGLGIKYCGQLVQMTETDLIDHGITQKVVDRICVRIEGLLKMWQMTYSLIAMDLRLGMEFTASQNKFLESAYYAAEKFLFETETTE